MRHRPLSLSRRGRARKESIVNPITIALFAADARQNPGAEYTLVPVPEGPHRQAHIIWVRAEIVADLDEADAQTRDGETMLNTIDID